MLKNQYLSKTQIRDQIVFHRQFDLSIMEKSIQILEEANELNTFFEEEDKNLLLFATAYKNVKIAKLLLAKNIDVHVTDTNGMTPLMYSCYHNNDEIVELLIKKNADLNQQTKIFYWTALMHASYTNAIESVKILLQNHARLDILDNENKRAIDIAKREGHKEIYALLYTNNV